MSVQFFNIVDFGDTRKLADKLTKMASRSVNTEPVMLKIVDDMMRIEEIIFRSQGRRGGGSWAQLKPETLRKKGGIGSSILTTEGANEGYGSGDNLLLRSLTEPGAAYQVLTVTSELIEFGTERPYADVVGEGSAARGIPPRPFMNFMDSDVERWSDWFHEYLMEPFASNTGGT